MLKFLTYSWRGLGLALMLFGIFWLPKDVQDSPEALAPWLQFTKTVLTQNYALWLLSAGLVVWILIRDLLPWWRDRNRWWGGIKCFSLRSVGCMIVGISDAKFDSNARAKAIADEYRAYINSGHMPLFFDNEDHATASAGLTGPYGRKSVGYDAVIAVREVESLARARGWHLPWPMPPKPAVPKPATQMQGTALQRLIDLGSRPVM